MSRHDPQARQPESRPGDGVPERQHSAGGVVVHEDRILLIASLRGHRWQLPKGHLEPGESARQAAVREIHEETGVRGRVHSYLGAVEYQFSEAGRIIDKRVDYYLVEYLGGSPTSYNPDEVSEAAWFPLVEGIRKLTFDNERKLAEEARRRTAGASGQDNPSEPRRR